MIKAVIDFFFPSNIYCIACGNLIDNTRVYSLCDKCMREIKWITDNTCEKCGKSLGSEGPDRRLCFECESVRHEFNKGFSCVTYEGPVKEILSGFKYKGRTYYAQKMTDVMLDRAVGFIDSIDVDMILPVPMHKDKEKGRGFNQAQLLSKDLGKRLELYTRNDILVKERKTLSMSSLSSGERRINLHNAFKISYNKENDIVDKNLLLVDDVYTTGSTADACAEVLKAHGANEVYIFTFASGVNMRLNNS